MSRAATNLSRRSLTAGSADTKRKPRSRPATSASIARIDFKPWKRSWQSGEEMMLSNENFAAHAVAARVAYAVMFKSRGKLMGMHAKVDHNHVDQIMASLASGSEWFKEIAALLDAAYCRILVSASAHNAAGGKFRGVHDMRRKTRTPRTA